MGEGQREAGERERVSERGRIRKKKNARDKGGEF